LPNAPKLEDLLGLISVLSDFLINSSREERPVGFGFLVGVCLGVPLKELFLELAYDKDLFSLKVEVV
jgi:hypothetical protein